MVKQELEQGVIFPVSLIRKILSPIIIIMGSERKTLLVKYIKKPTQNSTIFEYWSFVCPNLIYN
jgi:hypothetical protein